MQSPKVGAEWSAETTTTRPLGNFLVSAGILHSPAPNAVLTMASKQAKIAVKRLNVMKTPSATKCKALLWLSSWPEFQMEAIHYKHR